MVIVNDSQSAPCQYFHCINVIEFEANLIFSGRSQRLEGAEDADLQALRGNQLDRFGN